RVKVRIVPADLKHDIELQLRNGTAELILEGELGDDAALAFRLELDKVVSAQPKRLVLRVEGLTKLSNECARMLAFMRKHLDVSTGVCLVRPNTAVKSVLQGIGFLEDVSVVDEVPKG